MDQPRKCVTDGCDRLVFGTRRCPGLHVAEFPAILCCWIRAFERGQRLSRDALFDRLLGSEAVSEEDLRSRVPCRPHVGSDRSLQAPDQGSVSR